MVLERKRKLKRIGGVLFETFGTTHKKIKEQVSTNKKKRPLLLWEDQIHEFELWCVCSIHSLSAVFCWRNPRRRIEFTKSKNKYHNWFIECIPYITTTVHCISIFMYLFCCLHFIPKNTHSFTSIHHCSSLPLPRRRMVSESLEIGQCILHVLHVRTYLSTSLSIA